MEIYSIIHLLPNHIVGVVRVVVHLQYHQHLLEILSTTGEPIFAQSYINAYNTASNQTTPGFTSNYQVALKYYQPFTPNDTNSNFMPGTFGYKEEYENSGNSQQPFFVISYLQDDESVYDVGIPYLFVSTGSGAGPGFMYLDWIIVTYGVPYVVSVS